MRGDEEDERQADREVHRSRHPTNSHQPPLWVCCCPQRATFCYGRSQVKALSFWIVVTGVGRRQDLPTFHPILYYSKGSFLWRKNRLHKVADYSLRIESACSEREFVTIARRCSAAPTEQSKQDRFSPRRTAEKKAAATRPHTARVQPRLRAADRVLSYCHPLSEKAQIKENKFPKLIFFQTGIFSTHLYNFRSEL